MWVLAKATVVYILGGVLIIGFVALITPALVPYFVGAAAASYCWALLFVANAADGTWLQRLGGEAEQSTSESLKVLRRRGWHVFDAVEFDRFDVDHVLVGPGGVFALETKRSSVPVTVHNDGLAGFYRGDPAQQARVGAEKIRRLLKSYKIDIAVRPVVVVWGPGVPELPGGSVVLDGDPNGVIVIEGRRLRNALHRFEGGALGKEQADAVARAVTDFIARRDRHQATHR